MVVSLALAGLVACIFGLFLKNFAIFGAGPVTISIQVIAAVLMVWARLTFGIRVFTLPPTRLPGDWSPADRTDISPPDLRGHPLFLMGGDRGPPLACHRSRRPSGDGAHGSADRGGREAAGYNVPGVRSVCAGDEAGDSVCPIACMFSTDYLALLSRLVRAPWIGRRGLEGFTHARCQQPVPAGVVARTVVQSRMVWSPLLNEMDNEQDVPPR